MAVSIAYVDQPGLQLVGPLAPKRPGAPPFTGSLPLRQDVAQDRMVRLSAVVIGGPQAPASPAVRPLPGSLILVSTFPAVALSSGGWALGGRPSTGQLWPRGDR